MYDETLARMRKNAVLLVFGLVAVLAMLAAMMYGVRSLKQTAMDRNQRQSRETLATLNRALASYQGKNGAYPDRLERLGGVGEGKPETAPPERARLLLPHLARDNFELSGYRFRYQAGQSTYRYAATVQLFNSYRITAEPLGPGGTGEWFYYTDQSEEIRGRLREAAGPDDPAV